MGKSSKIGSHVSVNPGVSYTIKDAPGCSTVKDVTFRLEQGLPALYNFADVAMQLGWSLRKLTRIVAALRLQYFSPSRKLRMLHKPEIESLIEFAKGMTIPQAAKQIGVTPKTFRKLARRKRLKLTRLSRKIVRVPESELAKLKGYRRWQRKARLSKRMERLSPYSKKSASVRRKFKRAVGMNEILTATELEH
jgi:excisionase family DNA binding protein